MAKAVRGRRRNGRDGGEGGSGGSSSSNNVESIDRELGYYKHSYDDDYVYNAQAGSRTNYTQLVQNYETTAKSYASNATIIARGYYDAANAGDWDDVIIPLLVVTVVLAFCLGCCMGRCCCNNDKGDDADDDEENLLSANRSSRRRSSRQKILKTRSGTPRRRYNLEESFTETDNESYYSRYGYDETDETDDDSDGTGYYHNPGSPSSLSDYKSAQRESAARRKTLAATKRAAIAMKAKATAEAALAKATAKSDNDTNSKEEETKTEVETSSAQVKKFDESSVSSKTTVKKETKKWGKLVPEKKSDPLLEARSRSHNLVGYYAT